MVDQEHGSFRWPVPPVEIGIEAFEGGISQTTRKALSTGMHKPQRVAHFDEFAVHQDSQAAVPPAKDEANWAGVWVNPKVRVC